MKKKKGVFRLRNAVPVTHTACLLMERGNGLKADKRRGVKVNGGGKMKRESTSSGMTLEY